MSDFGVFKIQLNYELIIPFLNNFVKEKIVHRIPSIAIHIALIGKNILSIEI
jgi:hypothetical protein